MADPGESPVVPPGEPPAGLPAELRVPPSVLRSWDQAEAKLFPLVMAQPEIYELALGLVRRLLERLRETCPDLPALLAASARGGDLVADLADGQAAAVPGARDEVIAAAACAMRYRELVALITVRRRLAALDRARGEGLAWTVVEESGTQDRAPYVPYHRVEAEVASGRAVIVSIGPDETLSRAVYRLDAGELDVASGALSIGDEIGSYLDPGELAAALPQVRDRTA
jgi:hypothetical protein